jgi:hypothetical protein
MALPAAVAAVAAAGDNDDDGAGKQLTVDQFLKKCMGAMATVSAKIDDWQKQAPPGCKASLYSVLVLSKNGQGGDGLTIQEGIKVMCPEHMQHLMPNPPEGASGQVLMGSQQTKCLATVFECLRQAHRHQDDMEEGRELMPPQMRVPTNKQKADRAMVREMLRIALNAHWGESMQIAC